MRYVAWKSAYRKVLNTHATHDFCKECSLPHIGTIFQSYEIALLYFNENQDTTKYPLTHGIYRVLRTWLLTLNFCDNYVPQWWVELEIKFRLSEKHTKFEKKSSSWFWRLLSKCTKHKEDCANFCVLLRNSELF